MRKLQAEILERRDLLAGGIVTFDNGTGGYTSAVDSWLDRTFNHTHDNHGAAEVLDIHTANAQGVVGWRFVFGEQAGRIPSGDDPTSAGARRVEITSASVTLTRVSGSAVPPALWLERLAGSFIEGSTTAAAPLAQSALNNSTPGVQFNTSETIGPQYPCSGLAPGNTSDSIVCDITDLVSDVIDGTVVLDNTDDGLFFAIKTDSTSTVQIYADENTSSNFYDPKLTIAYSDFAWADVDRDDDTDADDVDAIYDAIFRGGDSTWTDLDEDGNTDQDDVDGWVEVLMGTEYGDANLDGTVDASDDGGVLLANLGNSGTGWATGDFTGDQLTDAAHDGAILLANLEE